MASTIPAFRGVFGSTEFFVLTMKVKEFVKSVTIPKELDEWEDLRPEEKFQREINYRRVEKHIAPYIANDKDRFIGAFIVEVRNHQEMLFSSLEDAGVKFPTSFGPAKIPFGVLYLSGGEVMIPLDGQHRLAALDFAMTGKNEKRADISGLKANIEVGSDTCTVILVRHDAEKSRKIFNKVNRNAKKTSKADDLITDDDDYLAVICREHIVGDIIPTRVVNTSSNTLPKNAGEFTTLSTVYEICKKVEEIYTGSRPNVETLPSDNDRDLAAKNLKEFWSEFVKFEPFAFALSDTSEGGDKRRAEIREASLACKPIVQQVLARVILELQKIPEGSKKVSASGVAEVVAKLNQVDWATENPLWTGVLMQSGKIIRGTPAATFAHRLICYLLGQELEPVELKKLKELFDVTTDGKIFPDRIF